MVKRRKETDAMRMTSERGGDSRSEVIPDGSSSECADRPQGVAASGDPVYEACLGKTAE
jgi:hypothetical protein